jgi:catechol 2,3-dioxygenase-like lactoylglutathione lyase family enzyme
MRLAHLTLGTRDVEKTAAFLEHTLGYRRDAVPENVSDPAVWLNIGNGQQIHLTYVEGFEVSPFEREFGRHIAVYHPLGQFDRLKQAIVQRGGEIIEPLRATPFERLFFREPVNGYVFEVIAEAKKRASDSD